MSETFKVGWRKVIKVEDERYKNYLTAKEELKKEKKNEKEFTHNVDEQK